MAEKVRSLIKSLSSEVNKHRLFNNTTTKIIYATGKAQEKLSNIQNAAVAKYDVIAKQVNSNVSVIQNLNAAQLEPSPLPQKVIKWWQWYQQLTGLDTVEVAKRNVIMAQNKLFKCQDDRRHLNRESTLINDKLKQVYSELIQTKRDDPKYVQLTIIENKNLQDQARVTSQLNLLEREEKDHFTLLATAIKEYHDSQTMNTMKYKYISILASAILAIISLVGSMIHNNRRIANVKNVITDVQKQNDSKLQSIINILQSNYESESSKILEKLGNNTKEVLIYNESTRDTFKEKALIAFSICTVGFLIINIVKVWTG